MPSWNKKNKKKPAVFSGPNFTTHRSTVPLDTSDQLSPVRTWNMVNKAFPKFPKYS